MEIMDVDLMQRIKARNEITALKVDLEEKISQTLQWEHHFNRCQMERKQEGCADEVHCAALFLRKTRPSFVAPGHALNCYIDAYIEDVFWDDIKYEHDENEWVSSTLREAKIIIEMQNCLIAIKSGLDRLVRLFSFYYRGISSNSTFGRVDEKGKSKGFMSYVMSCKDSNSIFAYIADEYEQWIQACVFPRDAIIHYSDFYGVYTFDSDAWAEHPSGVNEKDGKVICLDIDTLVNYVNRFYSFYQHVIMALCNEERTACDKEMYCEICYLDKMMDK